MSVYFQLGSEIYCVSDAKDDDLEEVAKQVARNIQFGDVVIYKERDGFRYLNFIGHIRGRVDTTHRKSVHGSMTMSELGIGRHRLAL